MKTFNCLPLFWVLASVSPATFPLPDCSQESIVSRRTLRLTGEVIKLEKVSEDASQIGVDVSLRLTISNPGNESVIVVIYRKKLWLGAVEIARSVEDASSNKYLYRDSAWPNNWGQSDRLELRYGCGHKF